MQSPRRTRSGKLKAASSARRFTAAPLYSERWAPRPSTRPRISRGGSTVWARMGVQGLVAGGTDLIAQTDSTSAGVQDRLDLTQTALSAAAGAGLTGALEGVGSINQTCTSRRASPVHGRTRPSHARRTRPVRQHQPPGSVDGRLDLPPDPTGSGVGDPCARRTARQGSVFRRHRSWRGSRRSGRQGHDRRTMERRGLGFGRIATARSSRHGAPRQPQEVREAGSDRRLCPLAWPSGRPDRRRCGGQPLERRCLRLRQAGERPRPVHRNVQRHGANLQAALRRSGRRAQVVEVRAGSPADARHRHV